jgi:hypothetical protein
MAIILHIGFPKTATTSLQLGLKANRTRLEAAGLLYPLIDRDFKQRYLKFLVSTHQDPGQADALRRLAECISRHPDKHVLLSCEELTGIQMTDFSETSLARLRDFLCTLTSDIRLIAYVRNPAEFYVSRMQEKLKRSGGIVAPDSFLARRADVLAQYEKVFQVKAIVRQFKRSELIGNDIITDFFGQFHELFQIDVAAWDRVTANESLTPETMFVLDLAHRAAPERHSRLTRDGKANRFWRNLRRIAQSLDNTNKPILFRDAAEAILQANEEDSQSLAERYGISFAKYEFLDRRPQYLPAEQLSDVESIVHVDRKMAFEICDRYRSQYPGQARWIPARPSGMP